MEVNRTRSANRDVLRVLQITDTHLLADEHGLLRGHQTDRSLRAVLDHAAQHRVPLDLVIATGDLAHHAEPEAYDRLRGYFERLHTPVQCLPGNHDSPGVMRSCFVPYGIGCADIFDRGCWRIIMLDSVVEAQDWGQLTDSELARLDQALWDLSDRYAVVCVHHQPVPIGNPSMDDMGLSNADEFFRVIDARTCVRVIMWGHTHSEFAAMRHRAHLLGTPSTCFQFGASMTGIVITDALPAYRWLWLFPDGTLETGVTAVPLASRA
ncbi:MAG: phosphodiesterase [Gammaproteobacteria bacterium]